jgi:glucose 1-dehydrogenase
MSETKTVLITGVGGGIGHACARHFADKGWRVIGVDRSDCREDFPSNGHFIKADISQPDAAEVIFREVQNFHPTLDVLVNNAAVQVAKPLSKRPSRNGMRSWPPTCARCSCSSSWHTHCSAAGGGAIVNVSSVHAIQTSANIAAYAASKGGLLALTRAMAIEFAPDNIRVNAILPGAVDTPMLRAGLGRGHAGHGDIQERLDNLARKTVNGKVGKPEEIAQAIYFLADNEQSSFMTGQALVVDGGATARLSTE